MEEYTFDKTLEREYQVAKYTWSTDQASGVLLGDLAFPEVLFDQGYIQDKIKGFKFFRAGVRLSFRVSANKFCYGKLMVSYNPMNCYNTTYASKTIQQKSGNPHILISANASEVAVLDVPFIHNKRALDVYGTLADELCKVYVNILNPLIDVNGQANTVTIFVTAQFIDSSLFFPHANGVVTQSSKRAVKTSSNKEALKKSSKHVIDSSDEISKPSQGLISTMKMVAEGVGHVAALASMFGLSKPGTLARTDVVQIQPMQSYANGKGMDYSVKLGMSNENAISVAPNVGGVPCDELNLIHIVTTPMLSKIIPLNADSPAGYMVNVGPMNPSSSDDGKFTYVDWITNMFAYFSGSYKYKLYITASSFQAIRMVFFLSESGIGEQNWQDLYHVVVDIQGDTDVEMMVPYCFQSVMARTQNNFGYSLWYKILAWSSPDPAVSAPIYINVYKSGCEDMQFGQLMERTYIQPAVVTQDYVEVQSNPRDDFKKNFNPLQESMVGYTHDSLVMGEQFTTLREVLHKFTPYYQVQNTYTIPTYDPTPDGTRSLGIEQIGQLFRFHRGSIRVNLIKADPTKSCALIVKDTNSLETRYVHTAAFGTNVSPAIEAEIPYWSNVLFQENQVPSPLVFAACGAGPWFYSKAAGDDFSFHFLTCPLALPTNVTNAYGYGALQAFFNANG